VSDKSAFSRYVPGMDVSRRTFSVSALALGACATTTEDAPMYGLIGKMRTQPGQRDALTAILLEGTGAMPGCLSYVIAHDLADADAIWITEAWDSAESHQASLQLPQVRAAIARARPLIAGFGERFETIPVGGHGLVRA
jgi:quinol monooxygenase YgiN